MEEKLTLVYCYNRVLQKNVSVFIPLPYVNSAVVDLTMEQLDDRLKLLSDDLTCRYDYGCRCW